MKKTFVILANAQWDSAGLGGNSSQQYARTLKRLGYDVVYVDPLRRWHNKTFNEITDYQNTIVMCDFPYSSYFYNVFTLLKEAGCQTVCRIVDHWNAIEVQNNYEPNLEAVFLMMADKVYASSPLNVERLSELRPDIQLLRNGVDLEHFKEPYVRRDLDKGEVTIGVVASFWFSKWIDLLPLVEHAQNHKDHIIHLIGNLNVETLDVELPSNVQVHGRIPWVDLPNYIHQFDVCVVPYDTTNTKYTNPIKILEYLACGKPVVSSFNPSVLDYPNIFFYEGKSDFKVTLDKALKNRMGENALHTFVKEHTWERRIETMINDLSDNYIKVNREEVS